MPTTRYPSRSARIVIARMAGFKPGTSPPPVKMAIVPFPMNALLSEGNLRPSPIRRCRSRPSVPPSALRVHILVQLAFPGPVVLHAVLHEGAAGNGSEHEPVQGVGGKAERSDHVEEEYGAHP